MLSVCCNEDNNEIIICGDTSSNIKLIASSERCGHSVFKFTINRMQSMVGKCVTSFTYHKQFYVGDTDFPLNLCFFDGTEEEEPENNNFMSVHLYHFELDNDNDCIIPVYLVNYSHYYDGWIDIEYSHSYHYPNNVQLNPDYFATIILGHSGSGKTTYIRTHYEESITDVCRFYNDMKTLKGSIIISDPELCDLTMFINLMNTLTNICPLDNIRIIYFENKFEKSEKSGPCLPLTNWGSIPIPYEWISQKMKKYDATLKYIQTIQCDKVKLLVCDAPEKVGTLPPVNVQTSNKIDWTTAGIVASVGLCVIYLFSLRR